MSEAVGLGATAMRSLLFAPGDRPDLIASALRSGADAVIVDVDQGFFYLRGTKWPFWQQLGTTERSST